MQRCPIEHADSIKAESLLQTVSSCKSSSIFHAQLDQLARKACLEYKGRTCGQLERRLGMAVGLQASRLLASSLPNLHQAQSLGLVIDSGLEAN